MCTVESGKYIFAVYGQMNHSDGFGKVLFEVAAPCCEGDCVRVSDLLVAKLDYVAFDSAFFKFWDYVENVHDNL